MYEIENGVPIPEPPAIGRRRKYPTEKLKVGQSFFVPAADLAERRKRRPALYTSIRTVTKRHPRRKFVLRVIDDEGLRVWRTR